MYYVFVQMYKLNKNEIQKKLMKIKQTKLYLKNSKRTANVAIAGKGAPILCLSGFGCDHYLFLDFVKELGKHFTMIMVDNRGMGKSEKSNTSYKIEDLAHDGIEIMDELDYKKFHLMGISMGGIISQSLVHSFGPRILSLHLLCTLGPGTKFKRLDILNDKALESFYKSEPELVIPAAVEQTTHQATDSEIINHIINLRLEHHETLNEAKRQRDALNEYLNNESIAYENFKIPTHIMTGLRDRIVNYENSQILNKEIKNSKLTCFEDTDHYFFMEKNNEVTSEIIKFFREKEII